MTNPDYFTASYRYWRKMGKPAHWAINIARVEAQNKKMRYKSIDGWNARFEAHGEDHMRWIEKPDDCGLRFVGYADELNSFIKHTGWYTDDDGFYETVRGVVYQLPARDGKPQYVAGYDDANNPGSACLSFDITEGERDENCGYGCNEQGKRDAASHADQIAERCAENQREYNRAWRAGSDYHELSDEISTIRKSTLKLIAEIKAARQSRNKSPMICETLATAIKDNLKTIRKNRDKCAELFSDYGNEPGFNEH